ncbi:hypothetical protein H0H93_013111, partial [Arthromyces matolae]
MAVWNDGMYCRNGNQTEDEQDAELPCNPLYMLPKEQWWFHAVDNSLTRWSQCDKYPPPDGEFLEIPANGNFTVQIATNRAFTTLSFDGAYTSDWTDGQPHLDAFCMLKMKAWRLALLPRGSALRLIPSLISLPALLTVVSAQCGEPNMYHQGFKCNVTGATSTTPLAVAQPAVWCENDQSKCVKGARQMIYWNQLDGNNIE